MRWTWPQTTKIKGLRKPGAALQANKGLKGFFYDLMLFLGADNMDGMGMKGVIVAGVHSGCGKTTVTLGLMAALKRRGLRVAPFKVGPDFIDPGHHARVTGVVSRNLDGWMLSKDYNLSCFLQNAAGSDIAVVEGVMGLFDGYDGTSDAGSAAQMAKWLDLPVVLVVDARSMARSAAALIQGFERFDPDVKFAGIIFNNLGSERHLDYLREAMKGNVTAPCLGGLVRDSAIAIPERHLGLFTESDHPLSDDDAAKLARLMEDRIDIDGLLALPSPSLSRPEFSVQQSNDIREVRIGVARDNAFCFYYEDNLDLLHRFGADLFFFSPMTDYPPENIDGLYFGGGYPELYARQLSQNTRMRHWICEKSRNGIPIYGECGGFMYLCKAIQDIDGNNHPMTGCFPFVTRMLPKRKALGYREISLTADSPIGLAGIKARGHEFHYSELIECVDSIETIYAVADRKGGDASAEGYRIGRTIGSYIHLHFGSRPMIAQHFVNTCLEYKRERTG